MKGSNMQNLNKVKLCKDCSNYLRPNIFGTEALCGLSPNFPLIKVRGNNDCPNWKQKKESNMLKKTIKELREAFLFFLGVIAGYCVAAVIIWLTGKFLTPLAILPVFVISYAIYKLLMLKGEK